MSRDLKAILTAGGATWLDLPILHPADPFLETAGEDIRRRLFVTEGATGARLALRPDFTIPVGLHHIRHASGPARYAYEGTVFRRHETVGDSGGEIGSERREAGYEDIGDPDIAGADARTLNLARAALGALGEADVTVRIGDIGLFAALTAALDLPDPWRRRLRRVYGNADAMNEALDRLAAPNGTDVAVVDAEIAALAERHDRQGLTACLAARMDAAGITGGGGRSAAEIAGRYLDKRMLAEFQISAREISALQEFLTLDSGVEKMPDMLAELAHRHAVDLDSAIAAFAVRASALVAAADSVRVRFDGAFGRSLDYYTGLVFEIARRGDGAVLAGGGRYDRLLEMLGASTPVPAVGLSLRLDRVAGTGGRK